MAGSEWLFGLHAVQAMMDLKPERILELKIQEGRTDDRMRALLDRAGVLGIALQRLPRACLDALAEGGRHQGVMARVQAGPSFTEQDLPDIVQHRGRAGPALVLILDGVTDPHNLGACLRTADAAGANAVVVPRDRAAGLTPVVRKVACGAAESLPLIQVTNLARSMDLLKDLGLWIVGTSGEAAGSLYDADLAGPVALVLGAEGQGMRRLTAEHCDLQVHIPMLGAVESLNVSVAAGVCLYEALRQRRGPGR